MFITWLFIITLAAITILIHLEGLWTLRTLPRRFDLKYIDYVGRYKSNATQVTSTNGLTTYLKDRGFVSLTFKTTF